LAEMEQRIIEKSTMMAEDILSLKIETYFRVLASRKGKKGKAGKKAGKKGKKGKKK
jgi:hypothetical protein